ncbi:MAG TPA: tRNA(His) guanylyltransferase Thg1 family protein [Trebonia sp.]|jgi:tRNA(His) 5'-end guanylyltransferase
MSSDTTALGDRMKGYESAARLTLPRRTYTIVRADMRGAHSYLRRAQRPFDEAFMSVMDKTAAALCAEMMGAVLAYVQSDEISVLLADFGSVHAEPWFGGVVQKMASLAAAAATAEFNDEARDASGAGFEPPNYRAMFDARVFTIPDPVEVANYFVWRQRDCLRNSVSMAAQAHFSHKRLHGLNGGQMQELLWSEKGVNWNDYPDGARRGRILRRVTGEEPVTYTDKRTQQEQTTIAMRSRWVASAAPSFTAAAASFLAEAIPPLPDLRTVAA